MHHRSATRLLEDGALCVDLYINKYTHGMLTRSFVPISTSSKLTLVLCLGGSVQRYYLFTGIMPNSSVAHAAG